MKNLKNFENQVIENQQLIKGGTSGKSFSLKPRSGKSARIKEKRVYRGK